MAACSPQSKIVARVWDWEQRAIDARVFPRTHRARGRAARASVAHQRYGAARPRGIGRPARRRDRPLRRNAWCCNCRARARCAGATRSPTPLCRPSNLPHAIRALGCRRARARRAAAPASASCAARRRRRRCSCTNRARSSKSTCPAATRPVSISTSATNRARVRELAAEREVLDCFCLHRRLHGQRAGRRRGQVTAIDSSGPALELVQRERRAQQAARSASASKATCSSSCASCATARAAST